MINVDKTNYIIFQSRNKNITTLGSLSIDDINVDESSSVLFVGIKFDKFLTWKTQIQFVNERIRRNAGILFRLRYFVPMKTLIILYNAFIYPIIIYYGYLD